MIQIAGELIDLEKAFNRTFDPAVDDPEPSKCSGFLKVTEGNKVFYRKKITRKLLTLGFVIFPRCHVWIQHDESCSQTIQVCLR